MNGSPIKEEKRRIFDCETHLINIESALRGLYILQDAHNDEYGDDAEDFRQYILNRLHEHTASLRRALFPDERLNRQVAS